MELIYINDDNKKTPSDIVVALGEFDGLHKAHMLLIERAKQIAKDNGLRTAVMTFDPHPDFVLNKRKDISYITPLPEKIKLLAAINIDVLIIVHFSIEVMKIDYYNFYNEFLKSIPWIVVGYDYHFGHMGQGTAHKLQDLHKNVIIIEEIMFDKQKIGSNNIRLFLENGNIEKANELLGRNYHIFGTVVHGSGIGRKLGFKTANVRFSDEYQLIQTGVYGVYIDVKNQRYLGMANFGLNPTINTQTKPRLEVNIFDFDEDIYGEEVSVFFLFYLREEKTFINKQQLIQQLYEDSLKIKERYGA